jgi:hypothetical protein
VEIREVCDIQQVILEDSDCRTRLEIEQGQQERLEIEAPRETLRRIQSVMGDGLLRLWTGGSWLERLAGKLGSSVKEPMVRYHLRVRELQQVHIYGGPLVRVSALRTPHLELKMSGAGNAEFRDLRANTLHVTHQGAGTLRLSGAVERSEIFLSGAGWFYGGELQSKNCVIRLRGVSDVNVWATEILDVVIRGAGMVRYRGQPHLRQLIFGLGSVRSA